jgi:hypothetical protein
MNRRLQDLLAADVLSLDVSGKADVVRCAADALERAGQSLECRIVPFVPGRRPAAEATHPGLGSSEEVALILPDEEQDRAFVLYDLHGGVADDVSVRARVSFTGPDGSLAPVPVPGWEDREATPLTFVPGTDGSAWLATVDAASHPARRRVLPLTPAHDFLPGEAWAWADLGASIRDGATDDADPFTFGHLFCQRLLVELRGMSVGVPVAGAQASLLVCDLRRCGSLYGRLLARLVTPDAERQATEAGVPNPGPAYHPWFPVLGIGSDKAALYTRALVHDIAGTGQHLSDPGWLMRVGLYLEFLTFLGICEAVRDDSGDLLSPAERTAFEESEWFAEIRASINPSAWRDVWELRRIQFPRRGAARGGVATEGTPTPTNLAPSTPGLAGPHLTASSATISSERGMTSSEMRSSFQATVMVRFSAGRCQSSAWKPGMSPTWPQTSRSSTLWCASPSP